MPDCGSAKSFALSWAIWIWLHRWIGLVTFLLLGIAALTGCVLCFVRPLDAALNADLFRQPAVARAIDVVAAVDRFQAGSRDYRVRSFPLDVPADARIPVKLEPRTRGAELPYNQVFLDRATGAPIGWRSDEAAWTRHGAMEQLLDLHFKLLAGKYGRWVMGVASLAWLVSNFIGLWLTWPLKRPFWKSWKRMWRFRLSSPTPRLLLDLHRSSGLWLLLPLTALAFTSVALACFSELYQPTVQRLVPPKPTLFDVKAPFPGGIDGTIGFTRAVARLREEAARHGGGWQPATGLYFPTRRLYGAALTDDGTLNYRRLGPDYIYIDGATGRLAEIDSPYGSNSGLALIRMLYPLHSGRIVGWIGVAIIFVLGLVTLVQCGTGVYVWWRKRRVRTA